MLSGLSVQIALQWIPREAHLRANLLSRFVDKDDWSLNPEVSPSWIANGVRNQLTVLRLTAMLRFQDLIVRSCLRAVAPSMPFPWIGEAKITGFVLLFPWLWTWLNAHESAAQLELLSSLNGRLRSYGLCWSLFFPSLPVLSYYSRARLGVLPKQAICSLWLSEIYHAVFERWFQVRNAHF